MWQLILLTPSNDLIFENILKYFHILILTVIFLYIKGV